MVLFGRKGHKPEKIDSLEDAKKFITAVIKDDATHMDFINKGFIDGKNLYVVNNTKDLFRLLSIKSKVDLIVADDTTMPYKAKIVGLNPDELSRLFEIDESSLKFYLACSITTDDNIISKLRDSMKSVFDDGFYHKTLEKWQNSM